MIQKNFKNFDSFVGIYSSFRFSFDSSVERGHFLSSKIIKLPPRSKDFFCSHSYNRQIERFSVSFRVDRKTYQKQFFSTLW